MNSFDAVRNVIRAYKVRGQRAPARLYVKRADYKALIKEAEEKMNYDSAEHRKGLHIDGVQITPIGR